MIGWTVAIFDSSMLDSASSLGRGMYVIYVVWLITLGLRLAKEEEREGG